MPQKFFIDAHCHFFSARHIPLTQTVERIRSKLLGSGAKQVGAGLAATAFGTFMLPLLPAAGSAANKLLKKANRFVHFFDTDAAYSIRETVNSLHRVTDIDFSDRSIIFTPLVMDFEKCVQYKRLAEQAQDLQQEIQSINGFLTSKRCLVLPFLGIDLRRFDDCEPDEVEERLDEVIHKTVGEIKHFTRDSVEQDAKAGDYIGIKLYPSLGCDLWPNENAPNAHKRREAYKAFLRVVADRKIPITVHCQPASYTCGHTSVREKELVNYAHPRKWVTLLEQSGVDDLRLNLAHFGGEEGVTGMLDWSDRVLPYEEEDAVKHNMGISTGQTWTRWIIKLLKKYRNVYTDLGAFNFADEKAYVSLLWLLHLDDRGELGIEGQYKLPDKLMWGSDVPMTIFDKYNYARQFKEFLEATNIAALDSLHEMPPPGTPVLADHGRLLERLLDTNPAAFLFGSS